MDLQVCAQELESDMGDDVRVCILILDGYHDLLLSIWEVMMMIRELLLLLLVDSRLMAFLLLILCSFYH